MEGKFLRQLGLKSDSDFRAKATFGVALAALGLLLPISIINFVQGQFLTGSGSLAIVTLLATMLLRVMFPMELPMSKTVI